MSDIQKKFYVLRAISGKENKVREYLEAELKNTDLGEYVSQVLIPTEKTFTVRNGKKVMKERAYLPGYVLVEAALVGEVAHRLRNIPWLRQVREGLRLRRHHRGEQPRLHRPAEVQAVPQVCERVPHGRHPARRHGPAAQGPEGRPGGSGCPCGSRGPEGRGCA